MPDQEFPGEQESKWYPALIEACQGFIATIDNPVSDDAHADAQIQYERLCRKRYERVKTYIERIEAIREKQEKQRQNMELIGE